MSVITENNKDHLLNYEGVEQLLVKINDRFARTDRYATPDTLGMIRAEINTEVNSEDISTGDNHPVQITTDGNAFVNIDIPTSLPANGGNADTVDGKHASDFATSGHTHDRFTSDLVHFDGAIHICNTSEYDDKSGSDRITGIYFSDNVEDRIADDAYAFIREECDDRLRVHSNYELKLSTGGSAWGNTTDDIDGPNIRIISNTDEDNGEDGTLDHTIQMHADNGVFVNGSEVAVKNDIPTSLKNPNKLTLKVGNNTPIEYDGSSAKTVNIDFAHKQEFTIGANKYAKITGGGIFTAFISVGSTLGNARHMSCWSSYGSGQSIRTNIKHIINGTDIYIDESDTGSIIYIKGYSQQTVIHILCSLSSFTCEELSSLPANVSITNTNSNNYTLAVKSDIPTTLKNPYSLTIQGNGTTIGSYDGAAAKTINVTPASIGADTKPFSTIRDFADGTLIKTNIDYSVTNGAPFYVEIKGNTYISIGSMFIQAQGYIYNDTIINYAVTSLGVIYPEQFIAINVDGYLCFWFPRIAYWHGYSVKVTTGYDYSTNCVVDVINSVEPTGTKRVVLSDNYFINHGFDGDADTVDGKHASDFAVANHNHTINLTGTFTPNITSSYNNGVLTISASSTNVEYTGTTDVENTNANPESWFVDPEDMTALF